MRLIDTKRSLFYNSWVSLIIFVIILIFQPFWATFYALRPSDGWLLLCLYLQIKNGYSTNIPFKNRFLIKNYGILLGFLAITASIIQASYGKISLDASIFFHFYRFLRFMLIFNFVENIFDQFKSGDAQKFWIFYTLLGVFVILLSFLEFNNIMPYKLIIMNQYFDKPEDYFSTYLSKVERLFGVMGNPNSTSILLVSTLAYPLLRITDRRSKLIEISLFALYVIFVAYVLVVMTASRTSIFISILLVIFILFSVVRRLGQLFQVLILTVLITVVGVYLYPRFETKIIVQERITAAIRGEDLQLSVTGLGEWSGRAELWQDRLSTFNTQGNPFSILLGLGYTRAYKDYADNGLLSSFINNGLIGLLLKIFLFWVFIRDGFIRAARNYHQKSIDIYFLAFGISAFTLLMWESTADLIEDYKLGQLFYLFLSMVLVINARAYLENSE